MVTAVTLTLLSTNPTYPTNPTNPTNPTTINSGELTDKNHFWAQQFYKVG